MIFVVEKLMHLSVAINQSINQVHTKLTSTLYKK